LKGGHFDTLDQAQKAGAVTINYGLFFNAVIRFVIIAFAIFILVKQINRLAKSAPKDQVPPPPPAQEILLREIRDILKARA
jgi:large conductance mechanosensitive channel